MDDIIISLVAWCPRIRAKVPQEQLLQAVEQWAGQAEITKNIHFLGMRAQVFDFSYSMDPPNNVLCEKDLRSWSLALCFAVPGGLMWQGVCCKSFVWICRSVTRRSKTQPYGEEKAEFAQLGNAFAIRAAFLAILAYFVQVPWFEQPLSSLIQELPYMN